MKLLIQAFMSLMLIGGIIYYVDFAVLLTAYRQIALPGLLVLVAVQMADRVFMAWKWVLLLDSMGARLSLMRASILYFISSFIGLFLPLGGVGPDIIRFFKIDQYGIEKGTGLTSIAIERVLGVVGSLLLVVISCLSVVFLMTGFYSGKYFIPLVIFSAVAILVLGWLLSSTLLLSILGWIIDKLKMKTAFTLEMTAALASFQGKKMTLVIGVFLALIEQLFGVAAFYIAAQAMDLDITFSMCLVVIPIAAIVARIPVALWGIGLREGIEVLLFSSLLNADANLTAAASFLMTATMYIATLPGSIFWLTERKAIRANIAKTSKVKQSHLP